MTMITPSYLGETIEYSSLHACRSTLEDPTILDVQRLGVARRPPIEARVGQYYTRLGLLDAYEVLRQLVDSTDELSRCCVVVLCSPEILTDELRGLDAYQALKMRVFNEVRDRRRENPFSSLVRVGSQMEAS